MTNVRCPAGKRAAAGHAPVAVQELCCFLWGTIRHQLQVDMHKDGVQHPLKLGLHTAQHTAQAAGTQCGVWSGQLGTPTTENSRTTSDVLLLGLQAPVTVGAKPLFTYTRKHRHAVLLASQAAVVQVRHKPPSCCQYK